MKAYVLSFTDLFSDRKEYVLAFNQHRNVYNDNNYIVAFDPWSRYGAVILDDMRLASKRRYNYHRSFIKDSRVIIDEDAIIEKPTIHSKVISRSNIRKDDVGYGKVFIQAKPIPVKIEQAFIKMQSQVNEQINARLIHEDGNVIDFLGAIAKEVRYTAERLSIDLYKDLAKGAVTEEGAQLGEVLKDVKGVIERGLGEALLTPFTAVNDKLDLPTLLSLEGFSIDKMSSTENLSNILVGSAITSQAQVLVSKEIHYAVTTSQMMSQLSKASALKMYNIDRMGKSLGAMFYEANQASSFENSSILFTKDSSVIEKGNGKVVLTTYSTRAEKELGKIMLQGRAEDTGTSEHSIVVVGDPGLAETDIVRAIPLKVDYSHIYTDTVTAKAIDTRVAVEGDNTEGYILHSTKPSVITNESEKGRFISPRPTIIDDARDEGKITTGVKSVVDFTDKSAVINHVLADTFNVMESYKLFNTFDSPNIDKLEAYKLFNTYNAMVEEQIPSSIDQSLIYDGAQPDELDNNVLRNIYDGFSPNEIMDVVLRNQLDAVVEEGQNDSTLKNDWDGVIDRFEHGYFEELEKDTDLNLLRTVSDELPDTLTDLQTLDQVVSNPDVSTDIHYIDIVYIEKERDADIHTIARGVEESYKDLTISKISETIGNKLFDTVLDNVVQTTTGGENEVDFDKSVLGIPGYGGKDVQLEVVESSVPSASGYEVQLETIEDSHTGSSKNVFLDMVGTATAGSDVDTSLDTFIQPSYIIDNLDTVLEKVEQSLHLELDKIVHYEQVEESTVLQLDKETSIEEFVTIEHLEGVQPVYYETLTAYNEVDRTLDTALETVTEFQQNETIKDVQKDELIQFGNGNKPKDTDVVGLETGGREIEYEAQDSTPSYATMNAEYEAYDSKEEHADKRVTGSIYIAQEEMDMEGLPKEHEGYMSEEEYSDKKITTGLVIGSEELADMSSEVEAYDSTDETATKKVTQGMVIGSDELMDKNSEYEAYESTDEESLKRITTSMEQPSILEQFELDYDREAVETVTETTERKITSGISITERPDNVDNVTEHQAVESKTSSADRLAVLRGFVSKEDISDLPEKEATLPNNDGIGEGVPVEPHPADPRTKKKIWSIMGKQYPAWNNWNPKKTR